MENLRFYFGVCVAGPIVGLSAYLLSFKPMTAALLTTFALMGITSAGFISLSTFSAILAGAMVHAVTGIAATYHTARKNEAHILKNSENGHDGYGYHYAVKGLREDNAHGPIPNAILWGYAAANRIAGIRYYNTNDIDKIEMGLNGFAPRPR